MTNRKYIQLVAAAGLAIAAGCQHHNQPLLHGENFAPEDQPRAEQIAQSSQAAAGAREDATLRPVNFNQAGLNALGQQKLDLMLGVEEPNDPLVVYLDFPADKQIANSHQSVTEYLKGRGLSDAQIKLVDGPNPGTLHPAADALTGLAAMQQAAQSNTQGGTTTTTGTQTQTPTPSPTSPNQGSSDSGKY